MWSCIKEMKLILQKNLALEIFYWLCNARSVDFLMNAHYKFLYLSIYLSIWQAVRIKPANRKHKMQHMLWLLIIAHLAKPIVYRSIAVCGGHQGGPHYNLYPWRLVMLHLQTFWWTVIANHKLIWFLVMCCQLRKGINAHGLLCLCYH